VSYKESNNLSCSIKVFTNSSRTISATHIASFVQTESDPAVSCSWRKMIISMSNDTSLYLYPPL
jgi:hypothetical protein